MIELTGKYNTAILYTDAADAATVSQIEHLLNRPFTEGAVIRIMPDAHAGMGTCIGTTMTVTNKVVPNMVGVDIGCGMETAILADKRVDLPQLDKAIHAHIPAGFHIRKEAHHYNGHIDLNALRCARHVDFHRAVLSLGTLGGGNHFIELGADEDGRLYLVIHSGSRNLGKQVCEHYQKIAADALGRTSKGADRVLAYLEGENMDNYLHDMRIVQDYAGLNRKAILNVLEKKAKIKIAGQFPTIHNFIDTDLMLLRKGAISAQKGEQVLIPMNMRDGSLLCIGKGNADWNYSAPHGAGRFMSRTEAKNSITLNAFTASMKGVFSSTINRSTLDEAPAAYKPVEAITAHLEATAEIVKRIKPLYNFKSAE
jgi:RNA-splicing ligase RtcB